MEEPILTQFDPADRPIVSLTLSSPGLTGAELTRLADPGITRRLRGISGVAQVNLAGAIERELVVELAPARSAGGRRQRRRRWCRRCRRRTSRRRSGRLEGALDERTIRLKGRLDAPADFKQLVVVAVGRPHRPARRCGRRARRHRGAALARALQRRGGRRHRHPEVHGLQHHGGGRRGARAGRRDPDDAAGRRDAARRARRRRARRRLGARTSRRR